MRIKTLSLLYLVNDISFDYLKIILNNLLKLKTLFFIYLIYHSLIKN